MRPISSSIVRTPRRAMMRRGLLGHHEQVVHDVLGLAVEALAQHGVLRGHADGAGVQVADAHHHAAERDQRGGREAELVGAEDGRHDHVAAGAHLAVGLDEDARAEVVAEQRLLVSAMPISHGMPALDRGLRRGAGAAVVARDHHVVGVRLRHPGGDGAHADLGDELHRHTRAGSRSAGRRSAASGPRSSRCRGAAGRDQPTPGVEWRRRAM